jgi:hypothetical protein
MMVTNVRGLKTAMCNWAPRVRFSTLLEYVIQYVLSEFNGHLWSRMIHLEWLA